MIMDEDACQQGLQILEEGYFSLPELASIFRSIRCLSDEGKRPDTVLILDRVNRYGTPATITPEYLVELTQSVATSANVAHHAEIVKKNYVSRERARLYSEHSKKLLDGGDPENLQQELVFQLARLPSLVQSTGSCGLGENLDALLVNIIAVAMHERPPEGLHLGYDALHELTLGVRMGNYWILAARPGIGKTSLALNMMDRVSNDPGIGVGFFSLEMSTETLLERYLSLLSGIPMNKIRMGVLSEKEIAALIDAAQSIKQKQNLFFENTPGLSVSGLRKRVLQRKWENPNLRLVFVDHLHLLHPDHEITDSTERVTQISGALKRLAPEANICLVALCQLSRMCEAQGRPPMLTDLRDSGSLEQDADGVLLLHRDDRELEGTLCNLAKHRFGPVGEFKLYFDLETQTFKEEKESLIEMPQQARRKRAAQA